MTNSISHADGAALAVQAGANDMEARQIVGQLLEHTQSLASIGGVDAAAQRLLQIWPGKADAVQCDTLLHHHHEAMNSIKRQEAEAFIAGIREQGFSFMDGMEALLVGSGKRFDGARASISAQRRGILHSWLDPMIHELEEAADGDALKLLRDNKAFHDDVVREMCSSGSTESDDARTVADIFARSVEQARVRLHAAGADIGRLDGWTPQAHDAWKLLKGGVQGKEDWITFTAAHLDVERSFPDVVGDVPRLRQILGRVYDFITTGHDGYVSAAEKGQATGPRNLPSGMDELRVLHFAHADAALAYNERYGQGNIIDATVRHLDMASRKLALMERLGPNPQAMLESLMAAEQRRLSEAADMAPDIKQEQIAEIDRAFHKGMPRGGKVGHWLAELSGETCRAANPTLARALSLRRATQTLAQLGETSLAAVGDVFIKAGTMRVHDLSWPESLGRSLVQYTGSYTGQNRKVARQLAIFMDFVLGDMHACWDSGGEEHDALGGLQHWLFKWSGLNWITERGKAGYAMWLSQYLGEVAGKGFGKLDGPRKALLKYHGIEAVRWDVLRQMVETGEGGLFFVPKRAMELEDAALEGLLPERWREGMRPVKERAAAPWQCQREAELFRLRKSLQMEALAMLAEETDCAIMGAGGRARGFLRQGTPPGTVADEFWRTITHSKNFPLAYLQRAVRGRGWGCGEAQQGMAHGQQPGLGDALTRDMGGLVGYTLSTMALGYAAMTLKDIAKGRQPRDPRTRETWLAVAVQSGGAGIYGDFFWGKFSCFGNGLADTLAEPTPSTEGPGLSRAGSEGLSAHGEGRDAGKQAMRAALDNAPFINLWYTRAAVDWAVLYHVREWMSPGVLARMERKMRTVFDEGR